MVPGNASLGKEAKSPTFAGGGRTWDTFSAGRYFSLEVVVDDFAGDQRGADLSGQPPAVEGCVMRARSA